MSYPTQNVSFYNPAPLNTNVPNMLSIQNELGDGQIIGASDSAQTYPVIYNYAYGYPGEAPHKSAFFYGGNFKSDNNFFLTTGPCNSAGDLWTEDTLYNWASAGKLLTGLVCTKMIEEDLINDSTLLSTIVPTLFTGTALYYTSVNSYECWYIK